MTGFLDKNAPSIEAEYTRYLDGDILGKIIAKNFLVNRIGYSDKSTIIPIGRYGDAETKYPKKGMVTKDPGDGYIQTKNGSISFEIKCARINIANRCLDQKAENWAFANILKTPKKVDKEYDILIAIGVLSLGLEDNNYWDYLNNIKERICSERGIFSIDAKPHQVEYLEICSFFIIPFIEIPSNYFRLTIRNIPKSKYSRYWAWGNDVTQCKSIWNYALNNSIKETN